MAGANANGVEKREHQIDYNASPLVICMNAKLQGLDLEIEGLSYKRRFKAVDVDHEACMKLIIKYRADTNAEL